MAETPRELVVNHILNKAPMRGCGRRSPIAIASCAQATWYARESSLMGDLRLVRGQKQLKDHRPNLDELLSTGRRIPVRFRSEERIILR